MKISDVMTMNPVCVRSFDTIEHAACLILDNRVSALPVIDGAGELVGVITQTDIMRCGETDAARRHSRWVESFKSPTLLSNEFRGSDGRRVDEIMSEPISIDENLSLERAVSQMEHYRVKCLPVTRSGKLCGVLSRSDLLRAFYNCKSQRAPMPLSNDSDMLKKLSESIVCIPSLETIGA